MDRSSFEAALTREGFEIVTNTMQPDAVNPEHAHAFDARLHAFVDVYRDDALAAATNADRERAAGRICGPLHGLPIAIKDLVHIRGRMTTAGDLRVVRVGRAP